MSVRSLSQTFESAQSPSSVNDKAPSYEGSPAPSKPASNIDYSAGVDTDRIINAREKNSSALETFLKNEVIPRGGTPGAVHKSAIGKPPPNELDNKAKSIPKFSGSSHPVYGLMLAGKPHETSTTRKKIVIPPSSAY